MNQDIYLTTKPNNDEIEQWRLFVERHPNGNIFQSPSMYMLFNDTNHYSPTVILAFKDNVVVGVLVSIIHKEYKGILGKLSSRSIIWGGPLILGNEEQVLQRILEKHRHSVRKKALFTQFRNLADYNWAKDQFKLAGFKYEEHLDILIDLSTTKADLQGRMHKSRRRNATKSTNKGSEFHLISTKEELQDAYHLIKQTYKKVNLPYPEYSLFENAFDQLIPIKKMYAFGAFIDGKMIGVRIELAHEGLLYDWYAGSDVEERNKYPNDFLIYKILEWGQENGFHTFDFGGAGKPNIPYSVRDHKLQFGGDLVNFGRFERINSFLFHIAVLGFKFWKLINSKR